MGAVLVLSGFVVDELDTVTRRARRKSCGRGPDVAARVGDLLNDGVLRDSVGRGALEQN